MITIYVKAGFPVPENNEFKLFVETSVEEPSDDYSERMLVFADTFEKLAAEIRRDHG